MSQYSWARFSPNAFTRWPRRSAVTASLSSSVLSTSNRNTTSESSALISSGPQSPELRGHVDARCTGSMHFRISLGTIRPDERFEHGHHGVGEKPAPGTVDVAISHL